MPGVPKSRGCNTCLKQKKKCDQAKPACSRCARLGVPCVGSGEQKYVFKPVSFTKPFKPSFQKARKREKPSQLSITHKPQNSLTLLEAKFVAALEVTDLRYGVHCYGDFLEHIPRRLGHSHTLNVSVDLMMSTLPYHYSHEIPSQVLAKYGSGLKVLKGFLNGTGARLGPEDLASFHIMTICQSWVGRADEDWKGHGQMLARFMDTASETGCSDIFELKSLDTSLVALFLEALIDPSIGLEHYVIFITSQSHQNTYNPDQGFQIRTFQLQRLIRIPRFLHEPLRYVDEIKITYQELRGDYSRIQCHLESLNEQEPPPEDLHNRPNLNHKLQVTEAIFLTAVLALNSILRATYPDDSVLLLEASTLVNELITLAKTAFQYRPLGASYIPPCLVAAWATTSALEAQKNEIETLLAEYQHDYARIKWIDQAKLLKELNGTQLGRLSGPNSRDQVEKSDIDGNLEMLMVHYKAVFGSIGSYFFPSS
ncbi:hypothetical protein IWW34DRAFT_883226 [Fusarium oxysporum f. sp. albedinis]|nr:hypothetical protein IWW34DRAFT_883226 [Fusarium oxysporum f. sp. albedinis]KAJ0140939.1 Uncharacterized protein HZ326_16196 [Fusarium oxysporum f. sp. albedinis]KAK2485911.1 hypothetical protein H9L39_03891 [Fusarium oxysporum f. sp. albedinis]